VESLLNRSGLAIAFWDADLRFVRVNERAAGPNMLAPDEHVGRTFAEVVGPIVAAAAEPRLREVLASGETRVDVEIAGEWPDGSSRVYLTTFFPVEDDDGAIVGVGAFGLETTELRLREAEAEWRAAEYERALRDYAVLIRHRLATPLTAIRGGALTLTSRENLPEGERRALLDLIAEQGALLEQLALDPITNPEEHELNPHPER
jgi:signal transduction histidine kinase